ncbi:MAG: GNAT family N-acetyltransferase [Chloroflexi bacterium]|nr:MAG: GNAT family N-acetyltransferase [Chloroflexota bacterium]
MSAVELLTADHDLSEFDCGTEVFDTWLRDHALQSQRSDGVKVRVLHRAGRVVAYYALTFGSVGRESAPPRAGKGLGDYGGIPVIILARLAVDQREQGAGLGRYLVRDALLRSAAAAEIGGVRALLIHAYEEKVKTFYAKSGIKEESPTDPLHLFLLMKDLRAMISSGLG